MLELRMLTYADVYQNVPDTGIGRDLFIFSEDSNQKFFSILFVLWRLKSRGVRNMEMPFLTAHSYILTEVEFALLCSKRIFFPGQVLTDTVQAEC